MLFRSALTCQLRSTKLIQYFWANKFSKIQNHRGGINGGGEFCRISSLPAVPNQPPVMDMKRTGFISVSKNW